MSFLDRIFPPHLFCSECGGRMVKGFWIEKRGYSRVTGEANEKRVEKWVCSEQFSASASRDREEHDGWEYAWSKVAPV